MKQKKWLIPAIVVLIMTALWLTGMIPTQIAKIAGTSYVRKHFPEMELVCIGVEYADVFGDYLIAFKDKNGEIYSCVIGPELFPVSIGQGYDVIVGAYEENYK
jgi:hypothetical protein